MYLTIFATVTTLLAITSSALSIVYDYVLLDAMVLSLMGIFLFNIYSYYLSDLRERYVRLESRVDSICLQLSCGIGNNKDSIDSLSSGVGSNKNSIDSLSSDVKMNTDDVLHISYVNGMYEKIR